LALGVSPDERVGGPAVEELLVGVEEASFPHEVDVIGVVE